MNSPGFGIEAVQDLFPNTRQRSQFGQGSKLAMTLSVSAQEPGQFSNDRKASDAFGKETGCAGFYGMRLIQNKSRIGRQDGRLIKPACPLPGRDIGEKKVVIYNDYLGRGGFLANGYDMASFPEGT
jgi:hypothetical protein